MIEIPISGKNTVEVNKYIKAMSVLTMQGIVSREPEFLTNVDLIEISKITNSEFYNKMNINLTCPEEIKILLEEDTTYVADTFNLYALSLYSNVYSRFNTTISYLQCCRKLLEKGQGYLLISERRLTEYLECVQLLKNGTSSLFIEAIYDKFFIKFE